MLAPKDCIDQAHATPATARSHPGKQVLRNLELYRCFFTAEPARHVPAPITLLPWPCHQHPWRLGLGVSYICDLNQQHRENTETIPCTQRCCERPRHRHTYTLQKAIETRLHLSLSFWSAMASSRATDFGFFSLFPFKFSQSAWLNLQTSESLVAVWPSLSFISNSEKRIIAR